MPAALILTAAATPANLAGVKSGGNVNGQNSAGYTFAGGTPGAADTIANTELLKGLATTSRLYAFLSRSYATQVELDQMAAGLGLITQVNGGSVFRLITAAPGVPTATVTTAAATGSLRLALGASQTA